MSDPTHEKLDLSTPERATKALHDLHAEQKRLKDANRDLNENIDKKASALKEIQQRMSEMESAKGGNRAVSSNSSLNKYMRQDGTIRARGETSTTMAYQPGLLDDAPVCDWQQDLQNAVDDYNMVRSMSKSGRAPKSHARVQEIMSKAPGEVQRIFADASGVGAEWIPDVMLPRLERDLVMNRRVASLFQTIPMQNKNEILPFLSTGFRPYIKAAASGDDPAQYTSSSMTTAQRTITATGFAVRSQVDEDAAEDSIVNALPLIRSELVSALVDGEEDAIINGCTGTHADTALASWDARSRWGTSGLGSSSDHRRAWMGLRHRALSASYANNSTDRSAAFTVDHLIADLAKLASPHGVAGDCVIICSPEVYLSDLLPMDDVLTMDKFGPTAPIVNGQLAQVIGLPIVMSEFLTSDLQTSGKFTTAGGATSSMLIVNTARYKIGSLRGAGVEVAKDITRGVHEMVSTVRSTFYTLDEDDKKNLHLAFNMAT
jgi:hypothetical protein